jgi:hypothetical protein
MKKFLILFLMLPLLGFAQSNSTMAREEAIKGLSDGLILALQERSNVLKDISFIDSQIMVCNEEWETASKELAKQKEELIKKIKEISVRIDDLENNFAIIKIP